MNDFDLTKYLAKGKLLKENLSSRAEELEMDFMDPRNKFGDEWQEQVSNVLVRKYDGHWENWENENPKELEMLLNKFKNLAEGKLHEAISPQDIVDIADTVAEEFTKEDADGGIFMVYSVGKMDVDDMTFELDTDTTSQTPERILNMSNLGVGEGWGGSFRIKPKGEGYEVRNTEKGGLVAIIDNMGSFRMISNDEAKAEMGRAKGEETDYMERRKETSDYMQEGEDEDDREDDELSPEELANKYAGSPMREVDEEEVKEIKSNKMKKSELKEMIKAAMMAETAVYEAEDVEVTDDENIDVDIEKDVKIDDEESEVDIDVKASMPGESEDVEEVQALLMKAQEQARDLGDDKLTDQIGNTITYFTRAHVAGNVSEADLEFDVNRDETGIEAELGLEEAELDENAASNLELKNVAKQLFLGFKKMGADVELATNTVTLNKKPADGNMDSKNVFLYAGDDVVEVTLVGEKAIGFFDPIKKDFSQFEFIDKGDGKTWNNQKTKSLNIIPGKTTSESLNESVMFPMWNKIK